MPRTVPLLPCLTALVAMSSASPAFAEPLRLRADALAQTQSPVGLFVLRGADKLRPWMDAETVTWLGVTDAPGATGDVLSLSVRLRDPATGSELRAGRQLVSTGAVRPLHLDGARGVLRLATGTAFEGFAGSLVARGFDYPSFTWAAGGRASQSVGTSLVTGVSYMESRSAAELARREAGADLAFTPVSWLTAAARSAFDLLSHGIADALMSASVQNRRARLELFATHRSPGRLLPATSLFSVLGDFAATSAGATGRYRLFPRLDVIATGTGQVQDNVSGGQGLLRATLALDDDWAGSLGFEARRVHFGDARWTGARAVLALPFAQRFRAATELELVVPDQARGRGAVWPWTLFALGYRSRGGWDLAAGVELSSGRTYRTQANGLARLTYVFDEASR